MWSVSISLHHVYIVYICIIIFYILGVQQSIQLPIDTAVIHNTQLSTSNQENDSVLPSKWAHIILSWLQYITSNVTRFATTVLICIQNAYTISIDIQKLYSWSIMKHFISLLWATEVADSSDIHKCLCDI